MVEPPTNPGTSDPGATSDSDELLQSVYSHYIIIGCSVAGIVWGAINAHWVSFVARMVSPDLLIMLMHSNARYCFFDRLVKSSLMLRKLRSMKKLMRCLRASSSPPLRKAAKNAWKRSTSTSRM